MRTNAFFSLQKNTVQIAETSIFISGNLFHPIANCLKMNFYCPNPDCLQKWKSNCGGISFHLHRSPQCRTVIPSCHFQIQTEDKNKFKPPTAKKLRTSDNNLSPLGPSQLVDETYLNDNEIVSTLPWNDMEESCPCTPTLLDTVEQVDIFPTGLNQKLCRSVYSMLENKELPQLLLVDR